MPVICSRSTWLMRSILTCMDRNSGTALTSMTPRMAAITGMITIRRADSCTSSRRAMNTPPTAMMGALTRMVRAI